MATRAYNILTRLLGLILVTALACAIAIQSPRVQTRITQKIISNLEEKIDGHMEIGRFKFMPLGALMLKDVVITDDNPITEEALARGLEPADTLLRAGSISVSFNLKGILKKEGLHLGRVTLNDVMFHLTDEPGRDTRTNIKRIFRLPEPKEVPQETGSIFDIKRLRATNVRYRMYNFAMAPARNEGGVHFNDLDVFVPKMKGHNLRFTKGIMHAVLDEAEFYEKSGIHCKEMTGRCDVGMGRTFIENFHLVDDWSDVRLSHYTMTYDNTYAFRDYINKVRMSTEILPSTLSWKSVGIWSGVMQDWDMVLDIQSAKAEGCLRDLNLEELIVRETGSDIPVQIKGTISGLPEISEVSTDFDISGMTFTTSGLTRLLRGILPAGSSVDLGKMAKGRLFSFSGHGSGPLSRLAVRGKLASTAGNLNATATVRNISTGRPVEITGRVDASNMDAGLFAGTDLLGKVSAVTGFTAKFGRTTDIKLDSLRIDRFAFKGHEYSGIRLDGTMNGSTVSGRITSSDPDASFHLVGSGDLKPVSGVSSYKVNGDISCLDLHELQLDKRAGQSMASMDIDADIRVRDNGMVDGTATLGSIVLTNDEGDHQLGDLVLNAESNGSQSIRLQSSFADAAYYGNRPVTSFLEDLQTLTTRKHLPALYTDEADNNGTGTYNITLSSRDTRDLMSFFKPGIYLAENTGLQLSIDGDGGLEGLLSSDRIASGTKYLRDARLNFDNHDDKLNAALTGSRLYAGALDFKDIVLTADAEDNAISTRLKYEGFSNISDGGEIAVNGELMRNAGDSLVITARPLQSWFKIGSGTWRLGRSRITAVGNDIDVENFTIMNGDQKIQIDGGVSTTRTDTLSVNIENFDLSLADDLTTKKYGFKGIAGGRALITSPTGEKLGMLVNFNCDSLSVGGNDVGSIKIGSNWDEDGRKLVVFMSNLLEGNEAMSARAFYHPATRNLEANARFNGFSLSPVAPFVSEVFSETGGSVSGSLSAKGGKDALEIYGEGLNLENAMLRVAYTGVPYILNGNVGLTSDKILLNNLIISDNEDGSGTLDGSISYGSGKGMSVDADLNINDIIIINSPDRGDNQIYGNLMASGNARLNGPFSALQIDANLSNAGDGELHVPVGGSLTSTRSNLLTFKEEEKQLDPYEEMLSSYATAQTKPVDIIARGRVNLDDNLRAFVEIDKSAGNIVSFIGNGNVNLDMHTSKSKFDLNGDYSITEGSYRFAVPGILNKDFSIQEGSSVKFAGDIMDSSLDINALYNVKTSLSTLIADSTVVASRRLVECGINITNKLRSPEISFTIDIPDLDPTTKSAVESALNTEDKIQKQFVALLIMGSFLPSENSGVFNGSNMLYSNMAEVFSNQLNSILQKLEIPFDLGIDYQGTRTGSNIFDVAISTQLFNNRVEINGSVGNKIYSTSKNPNGDVVGDLDISVKLDKPGKFRLNIFSHSADEHTSYLDYTQRNGLGLSYQKEYNKLRDFLRSVFTGKKEDVDNNKEPVIIKIENEQGKAVPDTDSAGRE